MPDASLTSISDDNYDARPVLQALKVLSGKSLLYGSALLAIAAIPGVELSGAMGVIATGLGVEALGSLVDRLASGEAVTAGEIRQIVDGAIAESGIEDHLSGEEFQHEVARLVRQMHLMRGAVEAGEYRLAQQLDEQYSGHQAILWELQDELTFVQDHLEQSATRDEDIIALLRQMNDRMGVEAQAPRSDGNDLAMSLSQLHLEYLRRWFGKPWARVYLADMLEGRDEEIGLLDVYVPLQVDLNIMVVTEKQRIVDWWVHEEKAEALAEHGLERAEMAGLGESARDEMNPKVRSWLDLDVDAEGMQAIVDGIQSKIDRRLDQDQETKDGEHSWYMEAQVAASAQSRFVLLGAPGGGKSSFLRHLTLCLAGELRRRADDNSVPARANLEAALNHDWLLDAYTPIYVEIRDLVRHDTFPPLPTQANGEPELPTCDHFWRYIHDQVLKDDLAPFAPALRQLCANGEAILLLDGLDEAPLATDRNRRKQIKALVTSLVDTYPDMRIIISSRPHAYSREDQWILPDFGRCALVPLGYTRLQQLAEALFPAVTPGEAEQEASAFIKAVRSGAIEASMRGTPLFFTMLAALWLNAPPGQRRLPQSKADLYRRSVDLLLDRWTRRRVPDDLGVKPEELRAVLEALACTVHEQSDPNSDTTVFSGRELAIILYDADVRAITQDISDYLSQHVGILVSSAPGKFHFVHRSFQEHLAACELTCAQPEARRPKVEADRRFPQGLRTRVLENPSLWENVFKLAGDELLVQDREEQLWQLLVGLCKPYLQERISSEAALLALQIADEHALLTRPVAHDDTFGDGKHILISHWCTLLHETATKVFTDIDNCSPEQRDVAGRLLGGGAFPGIDTRRGVGCRELGLPDIDWVFVSETDAVSGKRTFIYQEDEERVEPSFWIARYPITHAQFQTFIEADDGYRNRHWWQGLAVETQDRGGPQTQHFPYWNHPRERVSWYEAVAFCKWLAAKAEQVSELLPSELDKSRHWRITLPTEWQWEKAARGHDGRRYPWGNDYVSGHANINERRTDAGKHYLAKSSAVGMYPPGISPYEIHDLSGNVWEWCLNEYRNPEHTLVSGDATRVLRGGSWYYDPENASALYRFRDFPRTQFDNFGFRVVVSCSVPI